MNPLPSDYSQKPRGPGDNAVPFYDCVSKDRFPSDLDDLIAVYANRLDLSSSDGFYSQMANSIREQANQIAPLIGALPPFAATEAYVDDVVARITTAATAAGIAPEKIQIADLDLLTEDTQQAIKDRDLCVVFDEAIKDHPGIRINEELRNLPIGREKAQAIDTLLREKPALFKSVRTLNLNGLGLKTLPTQIQYFTNLHRLFLNNNQIQTLVGVNWPANLHHLSLDNNQIQTLVGVNRPANLQVLSLNNNRIQTLVGVNLPVNLKHLYLDNNQIQTLVGVNWPVNLTFLYLDNNLIQTMVGVNLPGGLVPSLAGNPIED